MKEDLTQRRKDAREREVRRHKTKSRRYSAFCRWSSVSFLPGLVITSMICWLAAIYVSAQSHISQALVTHITGTPLLFRNAGGGLSSSTLRRGVVLQPNDVIETGDGLVVIAMSDGSQVTIYPRSSVVLKDFSSANSWRDLLEVTVGRIRAKINRHGKRPNPYRVYSPIASIAVRGTEFLVSVESSTETRVLVYEGLVEVASLFNPQRTVLVKPGGNIVVRPDGDMRLVMAPPRGELNEITNLRNNYGSDSNLLEAYNYHYDSILMPHKQPRFPRFTSFGDSHLDSLRNPAYASEFTQASGRLYLIPSFSPSTEFDSGYGSLSPSGTLPEVVNSSNYTLSPQLSYFIPLGSRIVVGGGTAVTTTDLSGTGNRPFIDLYGAEKEPILFGTHNTRVRFTTANISLVAARRFGQMERTSLGIKFDYLADRSSHASDANLSGEPHPQERREWREARSRSLGLSIGLTHDFEGDKKLGIFYRYAVGSTREEFRHAMVDLAAYENCRCYRFFDYEGTFLRSPGHLSELGALFRGSITRRLFYGVEGSIIFGRWGDGTDGVSNDRRTERATLGAGIGYALRPRTVFSLDLSAGFASENLQSRFTNLIPGVAESYEEHRVYFQSLHAGLQTDLWRNIFVGGSMLLVKERERNLYRIRLADFAGHLPSSFTRGYPLSNFSAGWRMRPGWLVQYVYSTSFGRGTPSHSLMIRHEFGGKNNE
jgi:FecR protein